MLYRYFPVGHCAVQHVWMGVQYGFTCKKSFHVKSVKSVKSVKEEAKAFKCCHAYTS